MGLLRTLLTVALLLLMLGAGALFALQNTTMVPLDLLLVQLPPRTLALWLLLALTLGVVAGLGASSLIFFGQRARLASLKRQNARLNVEVDRLRKVGLASGD